MTRAADRRRAGPGETVTVRLLRAPGIDPDSYERFVSWCLAEELVSELTRVVGQNDQHRERTLWTRADGLKIFRGLVRDYTRRDWSPTDLQRLFERVQLGSETQYRKPIASGELLRLLWTKPHECAGCGRKPPAVVLHVDHIFPASRGGGSEYHNLQFLCAEHNLRKSNRLEEAALWLDSV